MLALGLIAGVQLACTFAFAAAVFGIVPASPAALVAAITALPADARIVLLDRDGTLAFAVAGAVMARQPQRLLRVLHGGLMAWPHGLDGLGQRGIELPNLVGHVHQLVGVHRWPQAPSRAAAAEHTARRRRGLIPPDPVSIGPAPSAPPALHDR
jgi:hypothetical protein